VKISTIIPAFNCEPYLRRAVESLRATNYPDLEIVIVDDGSQDGALALANQLQREHAGIVHVLTHPGGGNRGVSATRNLGIEASTGELIAFLDADDYVHPWRFDSAMEILSRQPEIDGVYQLCELVFADADAKAAWWEGQTVFGFDEGYPADRLIFELLRGRCWATSAIVFRRTLLAEVGSFEPTLAVAEDCHLWFRMAAAGKLVAGDLSRPVSAYWRHGSSAYQPSPSLRLNMIRAMTLFERWLSAARPNDGRRDAISHAIAEYILNGIANARTDGRQRLAWSLALQSVPMFPRLTSYRRWYGHLARMAAGR
jgi:glycosyltransferase involved in cell wall biosynthesis